MESNDYKYLLEMAQSMHERTTRRLIIALIICIVLMFASFAINVYEHLQYDYSGTETTTETVTVDGQNGTANYIGNNGNITNGEDNSDQNDGQNTDSTQKE